MIDAGRRLLDTLKSAGVEPMAALWLYMPESERWRLVVVPYDLESAGPKRIYERIQDALSKTEGVVSVIGLADIAVFGPQAPVIDLLRKAAVKGAPGAGVRFTGNVIDGTLIEDAYIYTL